jgi:L-ascorbate metabolism protein UlaG (beta-lactamase superfamily)
MRATFATVLGLLAAWGCAGSPAPAAKRTGDSIEFHPVSHASLVISAPEATIYVDPVGKPEAYAKFAPPDIVLITHAHGDHLAPDLLAELRRKDTTVFGPKAVIDQLKYGQAMANGERRTAKGVTVEAVPAYNTTKERLQFHPKGVGNGYVLAAGGKRIYISGDTEDVPEMRALKDIDFAFVCMNLPYTMTVEQAALATLEMKPRVVIPYHYRGKDGMSDLEKFKKLVAADPAIEVRLLKWY